MTTNTRKPRSADSLRVIYEDEAIIAVDKPAGLPSVPVPGPRKTSVWSLLTTHLGRRRMRAYTVHRIDRFTSGVLLFAKTPRDRDSLVQQFLEHTPVREYMGVVRGRLDKRQGTLVHYFRREGMHQQLCAAGDREAARAELHYRVAELLRGATVVRVALVTGLQNQIRAQFAAAGHPVVGDRKYQPREAAERRIGRVALHAAYLEFIHPRSGQIVSIGCDLPSDMQSLIQGLAYVARAKPGAATPASGKKP